MRELRIVGLQCVSRLEDLVALREEWSDLWDRCPGATPFQSPEWAVPWWRHLGRGRLRVLLHRSEGRLTGLAPLYVSPLGRVRLLGTGNTDYLDFLADPGCPEALPALLTSALRLGTACDFQQLSPASDLLRAGTPERGMATALRQEPCPVLPLPASAEDWWSGLPARLRSNLRYCRRRLEREGGATEQATAEGLPEAMDALFRLHEARWRKRRLPGVFRSARVQAFHHEAAGGFLRRGWLRLYTLRQGGEIRAALYCFSARGRTYYYAGGFDPGLARLSPGTVLTGHAIEQAVREGCTEFDFLRGDEPYKYAWGAVDRWNHRRLLHPRHQYLRWLRHWVRLEQEVETRAKRWARETFR